METSNRDLPLITVITLSYNSPDLKCAIDSVLAQTYGNIQYILLDDCSESFNSEEVRKYIEANQKGNISDLIVRRSAVNLGIIKESNIALSLAKGKYLFNVAGDDCFADEKVLEDWVEEFERTGAGVITAKREVWDNTMSEACGSLPVEKDIEAISTLSPQELFDYMAGANCIFGCCTARTSETFEKYGYLDENYAIIDDYCLIMKMLRNGEHVHFFDRTVIKYREGGISYYGNVNPRYIEDAEKIFANEILPYVSDKDKALNAFAEWKKSLKCAKWHARFVQRKKKYKNNKIALLFIYLGVLLAHPIWFVKRVFEKLTRE